MSDESVPMHIASSVLVNRQELIEKLKANRKGHREKFLAALDGWKIKVTEALEIQLTRAVEEAKEGKNFRTAIHLNLPRPEDNTKDYDDIIEALEWQQSEQVLLDRADFTRYVRDEWRWTSAFNESFANYSQVG